MAMKKRSKLKIRLKSQTLPGEIVNLIFILVKISHISDRKFNYDFRLLELINIEDWKLTH